MHIYFPKPAYNQQSRHLYNTYHLIRVMVTSLLCVMLVIAAVM